MHAYGRNNILVESGVTHTYEICQHFLFFVSGFVLFLTTGSNAIGSVDKNFIGSWNLPDSIAGNDDRERDRCTIFCVSKRAKPKSVCGRESVGGKTNIYFCSIARHGGSIVYILYTLGKVLHTRSYRLGSYRCFFPSVCCLSVNEALKRPPPLYNHIFPCCFSFLLFPPNGQITSGHIAHNWGNAVRQTHLYF